MAERTPLTPEEVQEHLSKLPDWSTDGDAITRTFRFKSYKDGIAFVNGVANAAEAADHHPDMALGYRRVVVTLTTHDAKGITQKDFALAAEIDGLV
ncbi:MAG: 4a-hydroxytetrahydrobiopterin dehydratase [SAR202 cluster bacterium]|jgi:4a-hydroxytetrahydrobiopterin dehydratase|nr:4a-hydroxytetrahydrobiopterin dehydratase [SAR202 cluster bacterium]|tara:strand:- start:1034 stop:1321 length:288 start_codon:yes stop_codon:yes gene_type:complete